MNNRAKWNVNENFDTPGKVFVGCLARLAAFQAHTAELIASLENAIGPIDDIWQPEVGWIAPNSYAIEMGESLTTIILVFDGFRQQDSLAWIKQRTLEIEDSYTPCRSRTFNLNPGIVDQVSMRLASHKWSPRRRQIDEGIWVEDQMYWIRNRLMPLSYTFQEYVMGTRLKRLRRLAGRIYSPVEYMKKKRVTKWETGRHQPAKILRAK